MIDEKLYGRRSILKRPGDFDFFSAYRRQAEYAEEMVLNLKSAVEAGELSRRSLMEALHTVENDADMVNHDIQAHLLKDFVVPLERGGMVRLAHDLDDVSDAVEEVAIRAYCYGSDQVGDPGDRILEIMAEASGELKKAITCLADHARKHDKTRSHLVRVQNLESECDLVYIEALHALYQDSALDPEQRRIRQALLAALEDAMDAMENAAESVEAALAENA